MSSQSRVAKQEAFVRLYTDFAARRNLSSLYTFTEEQLWAMSSNPQMEVIAIENASGVIEAVALFPYGTTIGYYYLNGSSVEGQQHARALIWTAMLRLKELGLTHLNLAGGNSPYDALHAFKSRFGATDHPTNAIKQIIDEEKYRALCQQHKVSLDKDGYFPLGKAVFPHEVLGTYRSCQRCFNSATATVFLSATGFVVSRYGRVWRKQFVGNTLDSAID